MKKWTILTMLGLAMAITVMATAKANAEVVVGVRIGRVVPRPAYVVVVPRPYYRSAYYPGPVVVAPGYVRPAPGFYYREHWCPRPYAYRRYDGPRYFRR